MVQAAATLVPYTNIDNHYLPYSEREAFESSAQNDVPFMFLITTNDTEEPIATVLDVFPWMADESTAPHYAMHFSQQPSGWRERGVTAYHGSELAYLFNMPQSVITHYQLGLVIDPATGQSLRIGDLNGNGVSGSQGDTADIFASAGFDQSDEAVIERMMTMWTNFAKTGDPSISEVLEFPLYDSQAQRYVELDAEATVKTDISSVFSDR